MASQLVAQVTDVTVYVQLLDEGVDVWRPVEATPLAHGLYRLTGRRPDGESWAFDTGDVVRCRPRSLSGDEVLVACQKEG